MVAGVFINGWRMGSGDGLWALMVYCHCRTLQRPLEPTSGNFKCICSLLSFLSLSASLESGSGDDMAFIIEGVRLPNGHWRLRRNKETEVEESLSSLGNYKPFQR